jgi:DNA-binding response OmpR family regulator
MGLTVLVVDDATFIRDLVKRALRQIVGDVELLDAADGARAQALIKQKTPDLILSDWEMPEISGEELLKWVRAQPHMVATPFIMITSRGDRNHVIAAVNAGVSDYICKPFTAEELSRKVHKQLKRIGFAPKSVVKPSGVFSSIEVLTGATVARNANPVTAKAPQPAAAAAPALQAHLRLAKQAFVCEVKEITLQAMSAVIDRTEILPQLFEVAALDILHPQGHVLARLNVYIHSLAAASLDPNGNKVRVMVRFVDQDPAKLEVLSQWIKR